jgi:hypothetical protein
MLYEMNVIGSNRIQRYLLYLSLRIINMNMETSLMLISNWKDCINQKDLNGLMQLYKEDAEYFDPLFGHLNRVGIERMWNYIFEYRTGFRIEIDSLTDEGEGYFNFRLTGLWQKNQQEPIRQDIRCHFQLESNQIVGMSMAFKMHDYCRQMFGWHGSLLGWNRIYQGRVKLNVLRELNQEIQH